MTARKGWYDAIKKLNAFQAHGREDLHDCIDNAAMPLHQGRVLENMEKSVYDNRRIVLFLGRGDASHHQRDVCQLGCFRTSLRLGQSDLRSAVSEF